jgi:hypothetical protein
VSKELSSVVLTWKDAQMPEAGGKVTFNASSLGPTVCRQRAASRAALIHENGGEYVATEHYADGSKHEFKNY